MDTASAGELLGVKDGKQLMRQTSAEMISACSCSITRGQRLSEALWIRETPLAIGRTARLRLRLRLRSCLELRHRSSEEALRLTLGWPSWNYCQGPRQSYQLTLGGPSWDNLPRQAPSRLLKNFRHELLG
jgi:hypothetical protein